jgi:NADH:ubiquinone oxidoreductase subunit 2 (subunit N)
MLAELLPLLNKINQYILNPLIKLVFGIALLVFFVGIFQFINSQTADSKRAEGQRKIVFGLVGMFVMISAYGIIRLLLGTFSIPVPSYPF